MNVTSAQLLLTIKVPLNKLNANTKPEVPTLCIPNIKVKNQRLLLTLCPLSNEIKI